MPQSPIAQVGVARGPDGHARPQAPQCAGFVASSTSQPFAPSPSQFEKPALHADPQTPISQRPIAFGADAQAVPQAPQCAGLDASSTSQPFAPSPSQSAKPAAQDATAQRPVLQTGEPLGAAQRLPQRPQLKASAETLMHAPMQH